jgi:hypothetical protein
MNNKVFNILSLLAILASALLLAFSHNIYWWRDDTLVWSGAYRMFLGQLPFRDFNMPFGYGFLLLPALFFKMTGDPSMYTLQLCQAFMDVVIGLSFYFILDALRVKPMVRFLSICAFIVGYVVFLNFPFYGNTAFAYELVGLCLLLTALNKERATNILLLVLGSFFIALSVFTKQDYGGFAFIIAFGILFFEMIFRKDYKSIIVYLLTLGLTLALLILPLLKYGFGYYFDHGQPPHPSRIALLLKIFHKPYTGMTLPIVVLMVIYAVFSQKQPFLKFKNDDIFRRFLLLTLGIIVEHYILKFTSYGDVWSYYFVGFGLAFAATYSRYLSRELILVPVSLCIIFLAYYYGSYRLPNLLHPRKLEADAIQTDPHSSFGGLIMFKPAYAGAQQIATYIKQNHLQDKKILNTSEFINLSCEGGYTPMKGEPMWWDYDITFYKPEINKMVRDIHDHYYDAVIYQSPYHELPPDILDSLKTNYKLVYTCPGPKAFFDPARDSVRLFVKL